jgi:hypothetical protein
MAISWEVKIWCVSQEARQRTGGFIACDFQGLETHIHSWSSIRHNKTGLIGRVSHDREGVGFITENQALSSTFAIRSTGVRPSQ